MEIKTKYKIEQRVFIMHENKIREVTVKWIDIRVRTGMNNVDVVRVEYALNFVGSTSTQEREGVSHYETQVFLSKEDLISSLLLTIK